MRALVLRARGRVPVATTVVVNLWERLLDLVALAVIAGMLRRSRSAAAASGPPPCSSWPGRCSSRPVRALCLRLIVRIGTPAGRLSIALGHRASIVWRGRQPGWPRSPTSVVAWVLPGIGFWAPGRCVGARLRPPDGRACLRDCGQPGWPGSGAGRRAGGGHPAAGRARGSGFCHDSLPRSPSSASGWRRLACRPCSASCSS